MKFDDKFLAMLLPLFACSFILGCAAKHGSGDYVIFENEKVDGGHCGYSRQYFKAKITAISKDAYWDGYRLTWELESKMNKYKHQSNSNDDFVSTKIMDSMKIKVGDNLTYVESTIKSGKCTPIITAFRIDRFAYDIDGHKENE